MKTNFRNIALTTALMSMPLKSADALNKVAPVIKNKTEASQFVKSIKDADNETFDVLNTCLAKYQEYQLRKTLNFIKMPKPKNDLDVSKTKFVGHPEFLDMFLGGVLKGKGEQFIAAQEKHGVNASFLIGIAKLESGNGSSDFAVNLNNIAGMRNKNGYMHFKSVDECIDRMAENLKRNYVDDGLTKISQIHKRYAEDPSWAKLVTAKMSELYTASKCMIYDFEKK